MDHIISTETETWHLSGHGEDMTLAYAADDDDAPVAVVPVTADVLVAFGRLVEAGQ